MNILLFEQHELDGPNKDRLILTGHRARHIHTILKLKPSDSLQIGMINGKMGQGTIIRMAEQDGQSVELKVELDSPPPPAPTVELILALPRPIMLQRILKQATVMGVNRIHLIRSARVEKSFFQTPVLEPGKIKNLLLEGLTQAVDTRLPEVLIHRRFKPFVQDVVPTLTGLGLLAHPGVTTGLSEVYPKSGEKEKILLAIGPEGGWNDFEVENFLAQGFAGFSMGNRILHVDTAVVALLAQLEILRVTHSRSA
ncbi:16S rRNA (uracil(1498)-N(3))-methyltransferase [Candidatus Electrothrix sp.]|uniref:16S rRNA (uracil(1498)-N(3))-methyltransferase n=1 Tax=Candidatus Electrothrix sp. TaxID=2170559 RepID=UPI00405755C6